MRIRTYMPVVVAILLAAIIVGLRSGRSRLSIDQSHFTEIVSSTQKGQGFVTGSGDELADQDRAGEDDEHFVALLPFVKDRLASRIAPLS